MEPRLQRRIQRYGWDLAAHDYEPLWQAQLAEVQAQLLAQCPPRAGERVLDVACGTGLVSFAAAHAVGSGGAVLGVDISGQMVEAARARVHTTRQANAAFARMDAEAMTVPDATFDVALCALGLMYMPEPETALREMRRVLRPGGRLGVAVWGARAACGWSAVFPIVDAEVSSEVCPLFFRLGHPQALAQACTDAGFDAVQIHRVATTLDYANAEEACDAAFVGGPVALAWSRFDADTRARVRQRYVEAIETWRVEGRYHVPGEFLIAFAQAPGAGR